MNQADELCNLWLEGCPRPGYTAILLSLRDQGILPEWHDIDFQTWKITAKKAPELLAQSGAKMGISPVTQTGAV